MRRKNVLAWSSLLRLFLLPLTTGGLQPLHLAQRRQGPCIIRKSALTEREDYEAVAAKATVEDVALPVMPTYGSLARFAGPALALWITGPLLSLIDSSAVGLSGATSGLAALGPATTFVDGATYTFAFISVATTNCFAAASAKDDTEEARLVVATSIRCALRCGVGVMVLMLAAAPQMLSLYVGGGSGPNVVAPAARYVRIRALSMPTLLLSNGLQAALLGAQDSVTPLLALGTAAAMNAVGDVILVCGARLGLSGAAAATVVSQWAGLTLLLRAARQKLPMPRPNPARQRQQWRPWSLQQKKNMMSDSPVKNETENYERLKMRRNFYAFCPPILGVVFGKMAAFAFMTHVASCLSAAHLAAHQLVLSLFFLLSPFSEIASQTFQAFLPQFIMNETAPPTSTRAQELRALTERLTRRLQISFFGVGIVVAALGALVPVLGASLFTNDLAVITALRPLSPLLFASAALHSLVCSAEGALLVRRDLGFLSALYAASAVLMPLSLLALKRSGPSLPAVWKHFVAFQAIRAVLLNWRVWKTPASITEIKR